MAAFAVAAPATAAKGGKGKGKGKAAASATASSKGSGKISTKGRGGSGKSLTRPAVTKMKFKLDEHEVLQGGTVTGDVTVWTRSGGSWQPFAGAELTVKLDGVAIGTVVTLGDGTAEVSAPADTIGEHNLKVFYAGDATHKKAQRAQGFEVWGTWYADADGDGYGDPAVSSSGLEQPEGYVADSTDCDDTNALVNPGASEVGGNGTDDDCDGMADETLWYADADADTFGDATQSVESDVQPTGYVADSSDCNDADATVYPGATETPDDGIDQDCDGSDAVTISGDAS